MVCIVLCTHPTILFAFVFYDAHLPFVCASLCNRASCSQLCSNINTRCQFTHTPTHTHTRSIHRHLLQLSSPHCRSNFYIMRLYGPLDIYMLCFCFFTLLQSGIKEVPGTEQSCLSPWLVPHLTALMDTRVKRELVSAFFLYTLCICMQQGILHMLR